MKEVVQKEVLEWLNIVIIYSIFDSLWVSPIQVVPRKKGNDSGAKWKQWVDPIETSG